MFAVALVPATGLSFYHTHDEHEDSAEHNAGPTTLGFIAHAVGTHHAEGLHAHQIGWQQIQKSSGVREIGAPVLVARVWVQMLSSISSANRFVDQLGAAPRGAPLHAPPPLLRSMAFLI